MENRTTGRHCASLEALKTNDGIYLASFIDEAKCFKDLSWTKCKSKYMDDPNVKITYKDVVLEVDREPQLLRSKPVG